MHERIENEAYYEASADANRVFAALLLTTAVGLWWRVLAAPGFIPQPGLAESAAVTAFGLLVGWFMLREVDRVDSLRWQDTKSEASGMVSGDIMRGDRQAAISHVAEWALKEVQSENQDGCPRR